jgi:hypothetical protein
MGFWNVSIVRSSKKTRNLYVSETGSASVLRCRRGGDAYSVGSLRKS